MDTESIRTFLDGFADMVRFLAGSPTGRWLVAAGLALFLVLRVGAALRVRALACRSAGERLGFFEAAILSVKEFYSFFLALVAALPALAAAVLTSLALVAVSDSLKSMDRIRLNAERIRELSAVVRNLEGRRRVMDVRVLSVEDGASTLAFEYYDPTVESGPVASQELSIRGTDIYIDSIVCNFDYAEIAQGRRVNIAVPYRLFSDLVPQAEGLPLGTRNAEGIPYAFGRSDEGIYGIAPDAYRARVAELVAIMDDEGRARGEGIVRSLYGSAVHRRVRTGDRYSVWVEQSGGLSIKDTSSF